DARPIAPAPVVPPIAPATAPPLAQKQQQPPQGQRIVNTLPAVAAQRDAAMRDQQPPAQRDSGKPVVQPVAKQPLAKATVSQRDDAAPTPARVGDAARNAAKQEAPKTAAEQRKPDQDRKLLALSRL